MAFFFFFIRPSSKNSSVNRRKPFFWASWGGEVKDEGREGSPPSPAPAGTWVRGSEASLCLAVDFQKRVWALQKHSTLLRIFYRVPPQIGQWPF